MTFKIDIQQGPKTYMVLLCLFFVFSTQAGVSQKLLVDLYGHQLVFRINGNIPGRQDACYNEANITESVEKFLDDAATDSLISQMDEYAVALKMDDMAYLLLLNKVTASLMKQESGDCKTLFKYALLQKKGFDVFIGYTESSVTLYGLTNFLVDNCLFIERGNKKYYDLSFNQQREPKAEHLFVIHHQGKSLPIVMNMITPPAFCAKHAKKVVPFEYDGFLYFFTANINQSLVDYYRELPTVDINTLYLNYGLSDGATQSLVTEMKRAVSSMSTTQGVNFILQFVQTSFDYKKDEQIYGQEKFSFPEETLVNAYADCEDKAMLFAILVNKVMGLKTVALFYKDAAHINVAVENWNKNSRGNFTFKDHDYIVCEPSGKGFNIGESATSVTLAKLIDW